MYIKIIQKVEFFYFPPLPLPFLYVGMTIDVFSTPKQKWRNAIGPVENDAKRRDFSL